MQDLPSHGSRLRTGIYTKLNLHHSNDRLLQPVLVSQNYQLYGNHCNNDFGTDIIRPAQIRKKIM